MKKSPEARREGPEVVAQAMRDLINVTRGCVTKELNELHENGSASV